MGTLLRISPAHRGQEHGLSVSLAFPFHSPCNYRIKPCTCLTHTSSQARGRLLSCIYSLLVRHPAAAKREPFPAPALGTGNVIFPLQLTSAYAWHQRISRYPTGDCERRKSCLFGKVFWQVSKWYRAFESLRWEAEMAHSPSPCFCLLPACFLSL